MKTGYKVFFLFYVVAVIVVAFLIFNEQTKNKKLDNFGMKTHGLLDKDYTEMRKRASHWFIVIYEYDVSGVTYKGQSRLKEEPKSRRVIVFYDPSDPLNSRLENGEKDSMYIRYLYISVIILITIIIPIFSKKSDGKYIFQK